MTAANSITVKASQIIQAALREINALGIGETMSAEDAAWGLEKLQRLIDRYNADRAMIYNISFLPPVALIPNHAPHTIGPGGNFDINQRPIEILSATLLLSGGNPAVEIPLNLQNDAWWAAQTIKGLTSPLCTDLYYSADWPLGNLNFWPVCTQALQVRLEVRTVLTEYAALTTNFTLPPGYWDAVIYPLAVSLWPAFFKDQSPSPLLIRLAGEAIKTVTANNVQSPRIATDPFSDSGWGVIPNFNFLTGLPR